MKKRITKILGVVLSLALLSSLAMIAAPVTAAPGMNAWGGVGLPPVVDNNDVEVLAQATDGTLFLSVHDTFAGTYTIYKSTNGGWTWTITKFKDYGEEITAIVTAPNWDSNDTFYVGTRDGQVFRCTGAGADTPILLRQIVDSMAIQADTVYDMDLWTDGGSVWIMVATDIDVLVMEDALFSEWIDMDLTISFDGVKFSQDGVTQHGNFYRAYVSRFAPDFDQSGLIWAILRDTNDHGWITATVSPGQWGQVINSVEHIHAGNIRQWVDLDFADYYSSTSAPILFLALNQTSGLDLGDDIYLLEGGFGATSTVLTALEVNGGGLDFMSIQVSGDVIMCSEFLTNDVWVSRNGGDTFTLAIKEPTGTSKTSILMAPGAFDPDDGVAYAITSGVESAFSHTADGGRTWNQIAFVDTDIDAIRDLSFGSTFLITDAIPGAESVWRTDDITVAKPQWERVWCTQINGLDDLVLIRQIMDGSGLMIYAEDGGDEELWKSTDNGQTWNHWRTLPPAMGDINDFVAYDGATVFAATEGGFYGTTRFGPAKQRLTTENLRSIALQPGFDPSDSDNSTVLVGNSSSSAYASADAGNVWGAAKAIGTGDHLVYVAFDSTGKAYFATGGSAVYSSAITGSTIGTTTTTVGMLKDSVGGTAEATSFSGIWIAPDNALYAIGGEEDITQAFSEWRIQGYVDIVHYQFGTDPISTGVYIDEPLMGLTGTFVDGEDVTIEDDEVYGTGWTGVAGEIYIADASIPANGTITIDFDSLILANYEYPFEDGDSISFINTDLKSEWVEVAAEVTVTSASLYRLLLGETGNIWEMEAKNGAMGIWGFAGSNFVFTVVEGDSLYGLEDTLSGKVQGVTVSSIGENKATVNWTAMTGAKQYIVKYNGTTVDVNPVGSSTTPPTSKTLTLLTDDKTYNVTVRVETDKAFQSRWSDAASFTTLQAVGQPKNLVPGNGMQDAPLLPSFVWEDTSGNAVEYDFQLSTDPGMGTLLVDTTTVNTAYTLTTELAYDTNHYWRVRAVSDTGTKSTWCFSNFHTRVEAMPPVIIEPPPTPTIILPAPQVTVIPPDIDITLPAPIVTVIPPDITVNVPPVVTVTQQAQPTLVLPVAEDAGTPVYIWVIVGIGAILTIAVIVLIIRTRRVV